ncbi:hypothetical protein U1Q18_009622, partial [Sarracenia purpurea var. burkii]
VNFFVRRSRESGNFFVRREPLPKAIRELVHGDPELASMADEVKMEKKKWDPSPRLVLSKGQRIF